MSVIYVMFVSYYKQTKKTLDLQKKYRFRKIVTRGCWCIARRCDTHDALDQQRITGQRPGLVEATEIHLPRKGNTEWFSAKRSQFHQGQQGGIDREGQFDWQLWWDHRCLQRKNAKSGFRLDSVD